MITINKNDVTMDGSAADIMTEIAIGIGALAHDIANDIGEGTVFGVADMVLTRINKAALVAIALKESEKCDEKESTAE